MSLLTLDKVKYQPINTYNYKLFISAILPTTASNFQFLNATSNSTVRPIIFHQKPGSTTTQTQLLTVMPAGVRVQQLTPVGRATSTQPTTIVRLMSPATSNVRPSTGQQQFIQLGTNKQQQPLVIKAITTPNRPQQQPILLTTNTQQKTILPQAQQQVLVLNQNTLNNNQAQPSKITFTMTNMDSSNSSNVNHSQSTSTTDNPMPQLDGCDSMEMSSDDTNRITNVESLLESLQKQTSTKIIDEFIPQIDGTSDDQVIFFL